jgi:phosphate/sulfate permease
MVGYWISQSRLIDTIEESIGEITPAEPVALARSVG